MRARLLLRVVLMQRPECRVPSAECRVPSAAAHLLLRVFEHRRISSLPAKKAVENPLAARDRGGGTRSATRVVPEARPRGHYLMTPWALHDDPMGAI